MRQGDVSQSTSAEATLTALQHLVRTVTDQMQSNNLLLLSNTDQFVRGRRLVILIKHGARHGSELSTDAAIRSPSAFYPKKLTEVL